jgi:hypothetical protein
VPLILLYRHQFPACTWPSMQHYKTANLVKRVDMELLIVFLKYFSGQFLFYFQSYISREIVLLYFVEYLPVEIISTVFP